MQTFNVIAGICSILGLVLTFILGVPTFYEWYQAGSPIKLATAKLLLIATFFLAAGVLQFVAVWLQIRRRTRTADTPPAPFDEAAHPNEDFPVTGKTPMYDAGPNIGYPSKVYVQMINNSSRCAEISISRWIPGIKATLLAEVLQLWITRGWCPRPDGAATLHVAPGQRFRLWLAPDKQYSKDDLQKRCDETRLGTVAIRVNGSERNITL